MAAREPEHDFLGRLVAWAEKTEYLRGVFFDDMTKVDFTITPAAVLPIIRDEPRLPPDLDLGYRVLVDKDA